MIEATAQTTVSTGGVWAIVAVASVVLAVWLSSVFLADRTQVRLSTPGPTSRRGWVGDGVADGRADPVPQGETPTRTDLPAQTVPGERPTMPRQRTGQADRAERSYAGPDRPDDEEPGR